MPAILFQSPEAFLQYGKWRNLPLSNANKTEPLKTSAIVRCGRKHSHKHAHWLQPSRIPLFTTRVETLAAGKHVIAKLVPLWIINLTRLAASVCMKVRFKSKVTKSFSFSPIRGSYSPVHEKKKNQEKALGPGYLRLWYQNNFARAYLAWLNKNKSIRWS